MGSGLFRSCSYVEPPTGPVPFLSGLLQVVRRAEWVNCGDFEMASLIFISLSAFICFSPPHYTLSCPLPFMGSFTSLLVPGALPSVVQVWGGSGTFLWLGVQWWDLAAASFSGSCWAPLPRHGAAHEAQPLLSIGTAESSQRCCQGSHRLCPQGPWTSSAEEQGQRGIFFLLSCP